jgi:RNA polymerase sigma-70 factor (ECF subfamily)
MSIGKQHEQSSESALWRELDGRFRGPLFSFFTRRVTDRSEAEDLTQEVFARLMRQTHQPAGQNIQAYVFVTAANLLKDRNRRQVRHKASAHWDIDQANDSLRAEPNLIEERNPERVLLGKETLQEFLKALEGLSERTRDIFILSRIERMHQGDIAKLFGISVSAVEKHVMKALSQIGKRLAGQ